MLFLTIYFIFKVAEKEVFSLTSFLSQTGGLLSIWIGLTMICVVEVLELIINCVIVFKAKRREGKSIRVETHAPTEEGTMRGKASKRGARKLRNQQKNDGNKLNCVVLPMSERGSATS